MNVTHLSPVTGVTFIAVSNDKSKYDCLTLSFLLPRTRDNTARCSLLAAVINRGTNRYPTMRALAAVQEDLYSASVSASSGAVGECITFTFSLCFINKKYTIGGEDLLDRGMDLLSDMVLNPLLRGNGFDDSYVATEKVNLITDIRSRLDNKDSYAVRRCIELMCEGELFANPVDGLEQDVAGLTGEDIYKHYVNIIENCPAVAVYTGADDHGKAAETFSKYLPLAARGTDIPRTEIITSVGGLRRYTDVMDINQSKLAIGFRTGVLPSSDEAYAFGVFNELFGASPTSRLFSEVREKQSLCYYCTPIPQTSKGISVVAAGIAAADKERAEQAIIDQLDDIKRGNITDTELSAAVRSLRSIHIGITDSIRALNRWYRTGFVIGREDDPCRAADRIARVTAEETVAAARRVLEDTVYFLKGERI